MEICSKNKFIEATVNKYKMGKGEKKENQKKESDLFRRMR